MGIGFLEIVIIAVAALVLLGPNRLPGVMRQCAKIYVQLRRTSNEFKSAFDHVVQQAEADLNQGSHTFLTKNPSHDDQGHKQPSSLGEPRLTTPSLLVSQTDNPFNLRFDEKS